MRYFFGVLIVLAFCGCTKNPVTSKQELVVVSEERELDLGKQSYPYMKQGHGGEYIVDPHLSAYVNTVGKKLAAVGDRPHLPYEFVVLNNPIPNAWALPGGKIAINRGLILELKDEAELAAVLSHELVHSAARHGAKAMERSFLYQLGLSGLQLATRGEKYSNAIVGAAGAGATLVAHKHSRTAELEADKYGIEYLYRAGYDPQAAVELQETFMRLSDSNDPYWIAGLLATHPTSKVRLEACALHASHYPKGGERKLSRYREATKTLRDSKEAYEYLEKASNAFANKQIAQAHQYIQKGIKIEPRESQLYALDSKVYLYENKKTSALREINHAIELNPNYFDYYLQKGTIEQKNKAYSQAYNDLKKSQSLLPTALSYYYLGKIDEEREDDHAAIQNYRLASQSPSNVKEKAQRRMVNLEIKKRPEQYVKVSTSINSQGYLVVTVANLSPTPIHDIVIHLDQSSKEGQLKTGQKVYYPENIKSQGLSSRRTKLGPFRTAEEMNERIHARVSSAKAVI